MSVCFLGYIAARNSASEGFASEFVWRYVGTAPAAVSTSIVFKRNLRPWQIAHFQPVSGMNSVLCRHLKPPLCWGMAEYANEELFRTCLSI